MYVISKTNNRNGIHKGYIYKMANVPYGIQGEHRMYPLCPIDSVGNDGDIITYIRDDCIEKRAYINHNRMRVDSTGIKYVTTWEMIYHIADKIAVIAIVPLILCGILGLYFSVHPELISVKSYLAAVLGGIGISAVLFADYK